MFVTKNIRVVVILWVYRIFYFLFHRIPLSSESRCEEIKNLVHRLLIQISFIVQPVRTEIMFVVTENDAVSSNPLLIQRYYLVYYLTMASRQLRLEGIHIIGKLTHRSFSPGSRWVGLSGRSLNFRGICISMIAKQSHAWPSYTRKEVCKKIRGISMATRK